MNEVEKIKQKIGEAEARGLPMWRGQQQLACWHIRQGDFETARKTLQLALSETDEGDGQACLTMSLARVLCAENRRELARSLMAEFDLSRITNHLILAKFQHNYGNILAELGDNENAYVQYEFAISYFEMAGEPDRADVRNNLARVLVKLGRPAEAHPYLDTAEAYYRLDSDLPALAHVLETRARAYFAQNRCDDALAAIDLSLACLTDEKPSLIECLITKGRILAGMKSVVECVAAYGEAMRLMKSISQKTEHVELEMNRNLLPAVEWNQTRLALVLGKGKYKAAGALLGVYGTTIRNRVKADPTLAGKHDASEAGKEDAEVGNDDAL